MLLKAEVLAIALVLVYVGAVMVLFLFVVMMLDINIDSIRQGFGSTSRLGRFGGAVIAVKWLSCCCAVLIVAWSSPWHPDVARWLSKALGIDLLPPTTCSRFNGRGDPAGGIIAAIADPASSQRTRVIRKDLEQVRVEGDRRCARGKGGALRWCLLG